jgi:membrane fusion protein, multidrug efflux system
LRSARRLAVAKAGATALPACSLAACSDGPQTPAPVTVRVGPESVATAKREHIRTGPILSGDLAAERQATVRAGVGGSIEQMTTEEGQPVRKGKILARIEARDLLDARNSAQVAVRAAEQALATSEAQRTEKLVQGGALARRDLDAAKNAVASAESQLAAARARLSSAEAQLSKTMVRAPMAGLVSDQAAKAGDVVTPGSPLVTIMDPSSMGREATS